MAAGVFFGITYTLINLSNNAGASAVRFGNLILYTGIVALASGLILLSMAGGRENKKGAED
jgi:hypothetical protein